MTTAEIQAPRTTMTSDAIAIENLTVTFSSKRNTVTALDDIDMKVAEGEFVSIVGPSGCGKSTLLKVIAGLTDASNGEVRLRGNTVRGPQRDIGYVFQRAALLEWRTVRKNILLQAEMRGHASAGRAAPLRVPDRDDRAVGVRERYALRAFRRYAATGFAVPRPATRAGGAANGRTVRRAGRADPREDERRTAPDLARDGNHRRAGHPLCRRGGIPRPAGSW